MNRLALLSAAALFIFGGIALAQTPPAPDESESVTIEVAPDAAPADEATPGMRPMRPGRPGMGPGMGQGMGGPGMGRPGGPGMAMHRPGMMTPPAELKLPETARIDRRRGGVSTIRSRTSMRCLKNRTAWSARWSTMTVAPSRETIRDSIMPGMKPAIRS